MQMQLHLHYITQHYATLMTLHYIYIYLYIYITLHYNCSYNYNYNCNYNYHYIVYTTLYAHIIYATLHHTTRHYTTLITLHDNYNYTTLYHTTVHNTTVHYSTLTTPRHNHNCNCNCNYTTLMTLATLQLQLHYTTIYNYNNYNCTTPHCIQQLWWGDHCNRCNHSKKTQLQPPVGSSVDSLCHPWFTTTNLSYRLPILEYPRVYPRVNYVT